MSSSFFLPFLLSLISLTSPPLSFKKQLVSLQPPSPHLINQDFALMLRPSLPRPLASLDRSSSTRTTTRTNETTPLLLLPSSSSAPTPPFPTQSALEERPQALKIRNTLREWWIRSGLASLKLENTKSVGELKFRFFFSPVALSTFHTRRSKLHFQLILIP